MNEHNCARYEELCSAAIDHALTEQEQKELDAHLAECPACRAYLEELRVMRDMWKELETPMPAALHEKIMGEIEAEVQKTIIQTPQKQRRRPPVFTMLAAAAACVMLAATGSLTGLFGHVGTTSIQAATADASTQTDPGIATAEAAPRGTESESNEPVIPSLELQPADEAQAAEPSADEQQSTEAASGSAAPRTADSAPKSSDQTTAADSESDQSDAVQAQPEQEASSAAVVPFTAAYSSRSTAADNTTDIPKEVSSMSFARCYTVARTDKSPDSVPVIEDMALIIDRDGTAYYSVENNESKIGKVLQELEKNGYSVTLNQSSGITAQRDAKLILLLVQQ